MNSGIGIVALSVLAAMAVAQTPADEKTRKPGSVSGTVTNSLTGQPIKKAIVTLRGAGVSYIAQSDADGRFRVAQVQAGGPYWISAQCPGFSQRYVNSISMGEEQDVKGVSVALSPLGVIAGKVVDQDGEPLQGLQVEALRIYYQNGARRIGSFRSAMTDDRGEYRIFDLDVGSYYVLVAPRPTPDLHQRTYSDRPEEAYPATYFPGATSLAGATATAVAAGAEMSHIDVHVRKSGVYHLRGKAIDAESRQPVHGVPVDARPCGFGSGSNYTFKEVQLNPDGTFDFGGMVPGMYCVTLRQSQAGHSSFAQQNVTVEGRDAEGVVLSVAAGFEISANIQYETSSEDKPKDPFTYISFMDSYGNELSAANKAESSFKLKDVFPLSYELQQMQLPYPFYLKSMQYGERDISDGRLTVTSPGAALTLVAASDSGLLEVKVQKADGTPASGISVWLAPQGRFALRHDWVRSGYTRPDGITRLGNIAPGDYKLFAMELTDHASGQNLELLKLLGDRATSIHVEPKSSQTVQVQVIPSDLVDDAKSKVQ